jgi:hypothetical protein
MACTMKAPLGPRAQQYPALRGPPRPRSTGLLPAALGFGVAIGARQYSYRDCTCIRCAHVACAAAAAAANSTAPRPGPAYSELEERLGGYYVGALTTSLIALGDRCEGGEGRRHCAAAAGAMQVALMLQRPVPSVRALRRRMQAGAVRRIKAPRPLHRR